MISSFQQSASTRSANRKSAFHAEPAMLDSRPVQGARARGTLASLVDRIRTLIDRTLDGAFGRFDY
jgi:hypothetical protein